MAATMSIPHNFDHERVLNLSLDKYNNPDVKDFNTSSQLLEEARTVFGDHRHVAAFVSLGNGISTDAFSAEKEFTTRLPEALATKLRHEALAIEEIHGRMPLSLEPGSYHRFDPATVVKERIQNTEHWQEVFAFERVDRMLDMEDIVQAYLQEESTKEQMKRCAEKLTCKRIEERHEERYQPIYIRPSAFPRPPAPGATSAEADVKTVTTDEVTSEI
jgi:hypothetical protein